MLVELRTFRSASHGRVIGYVLRPRTVLCDDAGMQNDGRVLPNLAETVVLHRLGLIRADELPMVAAKWLAADIIDTE